MEHARPIVWAAQSSCGWFTSDERVIRHADEWDVGHLGLAFFEVHRLEMTMQERNVFGRWEHVVVSEPDRPETAREPAMTP